MPPKKILTAGNPIVADDLNGFVCEKITSHFEASGNLWTLSATGAGSCAIDTTNHELDMSTGITSAGTSTFLLKPTFQLPLISREKLRLSFRLSVITNGTGTTTSYMGFHDSVNDSWIGFYQKGDNSWNYWFKLNYLNPGTTYKDSSGNMTAPVAGDILTIEFYRIISSGVNYAYVILYVNSTVIATIGNDKLIDLFYDWQFRVYMAGTNTVARVTSIDSFSVVRYL